MNESERSLARLELQLDKIAQVNLEKAVARGLKIVQEEAKLLCPVHDGELRRSIFTDVESRGEQVIGTCYTKKSYAPYVEFGTGPKGQQHHTGISPEVSVAYTQSPWWIHESQIDSDIAEKYHWFYIDTEQGRFYQCTGQVAQPFMYPALKNNEEKVIKEIKSVLGTEIAEVIRK